MDIQIQPHLSWEKAVLGNDSLWTVVELPWEYLNICVCITVRMLQTKIY